jgi:ribose/xylose/arabinose/galactoside ABC-type transport system permease subunit
MSNASATALPSEPSRLGELLRGRGRNLGLLVALVGWVAVVSSQNEHFFTVSNARVIGMNMSIVAIAAIGTAILIVTGNIDLSIGSNLAFAAILSAKFSTMMPVWLGFLAAIAISGSIGLFNGVMCWNVPISPIVITLGTLALLRGVVYVTTDGQPVTNTDAHFTDFGRAIVHGVPMPIIVMVVVAVLSAIVLGTTTIGRHCYAVGGNKQASQAAGIRVRRVTIGAFVYGGLLAGLAGVIAASRFDAPDPTYGTGFELDVITGVLLGGVSFAGGEGGVIGALLGVLALTLIDAGLVALGVDPFYSDIVQGALLILAVSFDQIAHVQRERYQKLMAMREQARMLEERRAASAGATAEAGQPRAP